MPAGWTKSRIKNKALLGLFVCILRVLEPAFARFVCKQTSIHSLTCSFNFYALLQVSYDVVAFPIGVLVVQVYR